MSANKVYVLAPNMKEVLLYRNELKQANKEVEVIRITSMNQLGNIKPKELHTLDNWSKNWEGNNFDLFEYCIKNDITLKPV